MRPAEGITTLTSSGDPLWARAHAFASELGVPFPARRMQESRVIAGSGGTHRLSVAGRYQASHGEIQQSVLNPGSPTGISHSRICPTCQKYFQALADYTGEVQSIFYHGGYRIFVPGG